MAPEASAPTDIAENLAAVLSEIAEAARAAGRAPEAVTLVAVSKTFGAEPIRAAIAAGHGTFGENRVQEAEAKWPALRAESPDVRLHLVGPLQTNKVRPALDLFDVVETVDRPKLARKLADEAARRGRCPDLFVQVNTGEEPQKHGILPEDTDAFVRECVDDLGLPVRGLMCIPPIDEEPSLHFALLAGIARRNGLDGLSMGMSADFAVAVAFGATLVRVGTAIFGARPKPAAA